MTDFITIRNTAILPLSQSRFEDLACPILYTAKHVDGVQEPANEFSLRGTQVHEGASDYVRHLVRTRQRQDAGWFALNILTSSYLPDAMAILREMGDWLEIDPDTVLGTEMYLALDQDLNPLETISRDEWFAATGRYPDCEGTLDLLNLYPAVEGVGSEVTIDDYKTFFRIIDADTFQSHFYPLLVFKHFPSVNVVRFRLRFVRYGKAQREVVFTRADVPKLENMARDARLRQIALHIEGTPLQAMPGDHCAYCPKLRSCPLGEDNPMTQDPKDVLRRALWAQELLKRDTAILKAHAALEPLSVSDSNGNTFTAGFSERKSTSYPLSVVPIVNANDPELAKKLNVSGLTAPLKAKKRAALRELVAPMAEISVSSVFKIGSAKDEEDE